VGTKRFLGAVGLLAVGTVAGCTKSAPHALISVTAAAPVEQFDLYVVDPATRAKLKHTGWTDVTKNGTLDISKQPFKIGLQLPDGGSFIVLIEGAIGKVNGIVPDRTDPKARQFFWIATVTSTDNPISAQLLEVAFPDDADADIFPDATTWPTAQPAAASWDPKLLDCQDKKGGPVPPELINPFAKEICGDGIDEDCNGNDDEACVDSDGDGDPDSSDCKPMDPKIHHPITDPKSPHYDPYPESANCCGYSLGKMGDQATTAFNMDPTCHLGTCGDGIDQDCNGADIACEKDQDCDTYPASAMQQMGCTAPANNPPGPDCNDCDKTINPVAAEVCDGIDNNCNGLVDETCVGCDLDGDTYQRDDPANNCPDAMYKASGKMVDCDDEDAGVFPGSTGPMYPVKVKYLSPQLAVCNDQSGNTVCGALRALCRNINPDASPQSPACGAAQDARKGCPPANCDKDGDGYIDNTQSQTCDPNGMFAPYDCNDNDPTTFPNAPSKCGEGGSGHNCNGAITCGTDNDKDGYDVTVDCDDNDPNNFPWNKEVCDGKDNDCDGLIDEGNVDDDGVPMVDSGHIKYCTDSGLGECAKAPIGHCVCSGSSIAKLNFDQASRMACPKEDANVDSGSQAAPRCYGAHQPSAQSCDPQNPKDDNCDGAVDDPSGKSFPMVGQPCWPAAVGQCAKAQGGMITGCDMKQTNCFAQNGKPVNPWYVCGNTAVCPIPEKCNGLDDHCDGSLQPFESDLDKDGYIRCGSTFSGAGLGGVMYDNSLPCEGVLAQNVMGCGDCADTVGVTLSVNNANIHPGATEICNGVDDSCMKAGDGSMDPQCNGKSCCGANGCHDLTSEVANCNMCGNQCMEANATAKCMASSCQVAMCNNGWGDCDGSAANGCETNLTNTVAHCNSCGNNCNGNNWSQVSGYTCASGMCGIGGCNANFADCDGTAANGCEVNLTNTTNHCGSCGKNCGNNGWANVATYNCNASACGIASCNNNFADCNGTAADGCETNLTNTVAHCGNCGTNCSGNGWPNVATYSCNASMCGIATCNGGSADCNGVANDGCEVNTTNTVNHCGGCATDCNAKGWANVMSYGCSGGNCTIASCTANHMDCNGTATDGCEVDTTQAAHCGSCNNNCSNNNWSQVMAYSCSAGSCGIMTCVNPYMDCNGVPGDGCEINVSNDVNHCGACGTDCTGKGWQHVQTYNCAASMCGVATCVTGFKHCTGMVSNGCETDTTKNPNCGACGLDCSAGADNHGLACVNSICGCSTGADCDPMQADNCGGVTANQCACGTGAPCNGTTRICSNNNGPYTCLKASGQACTMGNQCASGMCQGGTTCK
jgi:hypothetical protein